MTTQIHEEHTRVLEGVVVTGFSPAEVLKRFERLRILAKLLDGQFEIPVIGQKIGLDSIVGLIPIGGDLVTGCFSAWMVREAYLMGVPKPILQQMALNIVIDVLAGSVPVIGDLFDVAWKANLKNLKLLERYLHSAGVVKSAPNGA